MDTSKEYVKMCDCLEIRRHRPELACSKDSFFSTGTWLPRQDQIQEMLREDNFHGLFTSLYRFWGRNWNKEVLDKVESMEQFWLAFYMYEKHQKTWSGEEWK